MYAVPFSTEPWMSIDSPKERPQISLLGTSAMLFEAPGAFSLSNQRRIWTLARKAAAWPGVQEAAPGMTTLMLAFDTPPSDPSVLEAALLDAWTGAEELQTAGTIVELPVVYGGEFGPDLAAVADHAKLSIKEVISIHSEALYTVFALGSHPGFCYLGGLDPRISTPRKQVPILRAEAGSVTIGGMQAGVSASAGPSGWHLIGRTSRSIFDSTKEPPAMLAPGDMIRFRPERIAQ
jgi:KipI family sensor histidine kinase inhibitor